MEEEAKLEMEAKANLEMEPETDRYVFQVAGHSLFVCLFVCLLVGLFVCLFVCLLGFFQVPLCNCIYMHIRH